MQGSCPDESSYCALFLQMIESNDFEVELCTILLAPVVLRLLQYDECRRGWREEGSMFEWTGTNSCR